MSTAAERSEIVRCPVARLANSACSGCRYCETAWEERERVIAAGFPWPIRKPPGQVSFLA